MRAPDENGDSCRHLVTLHQQGNLDEINTLIDWKFGNSGMRIAPQYVLMGRHSPSNGSMVGEDFGDKNEETNPPAGSACCRLLNRGLSGDGMWRLG
jgi:hypothetical protein